VSPEGNILDEAKVEEKIVYGNIDLSKYVKSQ